jgi:predicted ester cyclase
MSPEINRTVARRFFAEQDRLRGGPAPELCTPDYVAHLAGNPPMNLDGHQGFAAAFYAGFPDLRHDVSMAIAEEDRAAVRFTIHGTHTGEFLGIAPTGRHVAVTATAVMELRDGRVATIRGEFDQLGLMRQLTGELAEESAAQQRGI